MMKKESSLPLFFIVGRERSGTTLLQLMLDLHPEIVVPTESPFITYLASKYSGYKVINDDLLEDFVDDLLTDPHFQLWRVSRQHVKSMLMSAPSRSFQDLCKAVMFASFSAENKKNILQVGDKNPIHSLQIPLLRKLFPEARFIFMTRDPRDQVASMMRVNFERKNLVSLACRWNYFNQTILRDLQGSNYLHVRHEDLAYDPEKKLQEVCDFLGLAYHSEMLDTHVKAQQLLERRMIVESHHKSLLRKTDHSIIFNWKKTMNEKDRNLIDQYTSKVAKDLGYESDEKSYNPSFVHLFSRLYGYGYFTYLKFFFFLPFGIRKFIFQRVISKRFDFWKESSKSA